MIFIFFVLDSNNEENEKKKDIKLEWRSFNQNEFNHIQFIHCSSLCFSDSGSVSVTWIPSSAHNILVLGVEAESFGLQDSWFIVYFFSSVIHGSLKISIWFVYSNLNLYFKLFFCRWIDGCEGGVRKVWCCEGIQVYWWFKYRI